MQSKNYSAYRITHKDGSIEDINAVDLVQALENMDIPETESRVVQALLVKENVRTLVADEPEEILFTALVAEGGTGSIATPAAGKIHAGDMIQLKAIPARNYAFVSWKLNGEVVSTEAVLNYTMPDLPAGVDAVFTATFKLADISWATAVTPTEAGAAGCIAFPTQGSVAANGALELLAVAETGFVFDHWERNGQIVSDNKLLQTTVAPLAESETSCIYTAVFTQE